MKRLFFLFAILCLAAAPLRAEVRYVDSASGSNLNSGLDWTEALATLSAAVDSSSSGDTVIVSNRDKLCETVFVDRSLTVYPGVPSSRDSLRMTASPLPFHLTAPDLLDGELLFTANGSGITVLLTGVVVQGGDSTFLCVSVEDGATLYADNCLATGGSRGFQSYDTNSLLVANGCGSNNASTIGMFAHGGGEFYLTDCLITSTKYAMQVKSGTGSWIKKCETHDIADASVRVPIAALATVKDCHLRDAGILTEDGGSVILERTIVEDAAVGISHIGSASTDSLFANRVTLVNCPVALHVSTGTATLTNSIVAFGDTTLTVESSPTVILDHLLNWDSCLDTSRASSVSGLVYANPLFAGAGHSDWRPLSWSRAVHASTTGGVVGALNPAANPLLGWQRGRWAHAPLHPGSRIND